MSFSAEQNNSSSPSEAKQSSSTSRRNSFSELVEFQATINMQADNNDTHDENIMIMEDEGDKNVNLIEEKKREKSGQQQL